MHTSSEIKFKVGDIKIDGIEPTEEFKKYAELEKAGKLSEDDEKKYLDRPYKVKSN